MVMSSYFAFSNILAWAEGIWGILTVIFWSCTYIFIVVAGFLGRKERKVSMPYIAGVLNAAWEIAATIYTEGNPGFIIWFFIDIFIIFWGLYFLSSLKKKILYCGSIVLMTIIFLFFFKQYESAFLFTVYLIDVVMAIEFIVSYNNLSKYFKVTIAVTKLLGDLFAGLTFSYAYTFVIFFAIISFICNCVYLFLCTRTRFKQKKFSDTNTYAK
ncbi:MAG: hypothetical protein IJA06_07860 [Oscillospiraceae bacterium]|nr:hypothetical protein [Oscillospiraceae bacterium]